MSNNKKLVDLDDLDIFEQELRGVNLEDTTFSSNGSCHDSGNKSNSLFASSSIDDEVNCLPSDPHEVFCTSQYRYVVSKELDAPDYYRRRYEIKPENEKHPAIAILELCDVWARSLKLENNTLVAIIDVQPVFVEKDAAYVFTVNKHGGFVVVEPDILVSITSIMSQMWCERKSALSMFFSGPFQSVIMLKGTIAHDLIGRAIIDKITDEDQLMLIVEDCLTSPAIMDAAYCCKLNQQQLLEMATDLIPSVIDSVKKRFLNPPADQQVQIVDICDIEDSYWNPAFGLKGKLDATVKIRSDNGEIKTVPMEFKTGSQKNKGRNITRYEHNGQVSLYTLLMRPRYGINHEGLLLYIVEDSFKHFKTNIAELQSLICMRNSLAASTVITNGRFEKIPRPGHMEFDRKCDSCEMKNTCAVMFRISPLGMSDQRTDTELKLGSSIVHLGFEELDFYRQWLRVITLEVEEQNKVHSAMSLWKTTAHMRERRGLCISNLKFVHISSGSESSPGRSRCYKLTLQKIDNQALGKSLLSERDPIILSTQDELCISYGSIETINDKYITINIERKLSDRSNRSHTRFIIDKIPSTTTLHSHYSYLADLMLDTPESERLRNYIIRRAPTTFSTITYKKVLEYQSVVANYNYDQRRAIFKSFTTDSFLFVLGMPGTGKTETIVGLLRLLSRENATVLLVAYTNNALDNILIKYQKYGKYFLRVGTPSKLQPDLLNPYSTSWLVKDASNVDKLTEEYNNKKIVASTLMGLRHDVFQVRTKFDYCIVDEASQALPTAVFGALKMASKYILFGDPDQLPAILISPVVKKGIKDSMFTLMSNPSNTVLLSTQYRMNSVIMNLANKLVYEDHMKCGSEIQGESFVELPTEVLRNFVHSILSPNIRKWTSAVLSKQLCKSVLFLETTYDIAPEEKVGDSVRNINEATIVCRCVSNFITCGYSGVNIGIIAPFRGQVSLIKQRLDEKGTNFLSVEVNTVDQYQGRDKDIIICSFTKSRSPNSSKHVQNKSSGVDNTDLEVKASILEDIRRLNVAIARAKKKLIMIGNRGTLIDFGAFKKLFPLLTKDQIVAVEKF